MSDDLSKIEQHLDECMLIDRPGLRKRLRSIKQRQRQNKPFDRGLKALLESAEQSTLRKQARQASLPSPSFPSNLPVVEKLDTISQAIEEHQVVIICGETGSGKTTQIPKICLQLGLGVRGMIGHTQPRRIAARSLSTRIAEELNTRVGESVGFKIRFNDHVSNTTHIKIMTDGILLAETQSDPDLLAYDTLIIDEAHERSLNIDFILGYLKKLLPRRPDLKVIITSATINTKQFAEHFYDAPIVEVSGRTYPVEVWYRPVAGIDEDEQDRDRGQALLDAVDELARHGPGDILVFFPGEREIREAAELLRKHHPPDTEVLPLFGRLSIAQQNRVFQKHGGRRIVLATNVAETSLTVPGIHYVVDVGLARISRYSYRTKVQRLPIERVSQASANQRKGRCGRIAEGICIRLYSEEDFEQRAEFTDAEILRTNLATVILQMLTLKLGSIEDFPFIDPPDSRLIKDGFKLLHELGAVDNEHSITELGRRLARLPMDVRLGRMILAGEHHHCLSETIIIAAALAIQDPRERPLEKQQQADTQHKAFADEQSDFISFLKLWDFYQEQLKHLSQNKLRKLCQAQFLSYVRMREWQETVKQLTSLAKEMRLKFNDKAASYKDLHLALLSGLLGNILFRHEEHEYLGARNLKLHIFPGSGTFKKKPKWLIAAELVETAKRYARTAAKIEPEWVEPIAKHLVKRSYFDPHWQKRQGKVMAFEQVSLYGLILVNRRRVDYSHIDSRHARELFIRNALVHGEIQSRLKFIQHNQQLAEKVMQLEAKSRRRDILVDEESLYTHFEQLLPDNICTSKGFEQWYKQSTETTQQQFMLQEHDFMQDSAPTVSKEAYPTHITVDGIQIKLSYHFEPGHQDDGITAHIPLAALNQLNPHCFEWLIPSLLEEKITALIKSLPKSLRRHFVPAPDFAKACTQALLGDTTPLLPALASKLQEMTGTEVPEDAWRIEQLPTHLLMNFCLYNNDDAVLDGGRDLKALQQQHSHLATDTFTELPFADYQQDNITDWNFGDLPEDIEINDRGITLKGFPALVADGANVHLRVFDNAMQAQQEHPKGVLQLFRLRAHKNVRYLEKNLPKLQQLSLHYISVGTQDELKQDIVHCTLATSLFGKERNIRNRDDFVLNADWAEQQLQSVANNICRICDEALRHYANISKQLSSSLPPQWLSSLSDIREQLDNLVYTGFISNTPLEYLQHLPRYLQALEIRMQKIEQNPQRDRQLSAQIAPYWQQYLTMVAKYPAKPGLEELRWMIEELRVSLFAQTLGTHQPISTKRLDKVLSSIKK